MNFYNKKKLPLLFEFQTNFKFSPNAINNESVPGKPCPVFEMTHYLYTLISKLIKYQRNCGTDWKKGQILRIAERNPNGFNQTDEKWYDNNFVAVLINIRFLFMFAFMSQ